MTFVLNITLHRSFLAKESKFKKQIIPGSINYILMIVEIEHISLEK